MNSYIANSVCVYNIKMLWDPVLLYCVSNMSVCLLSSCSSIIDPPDYNQPPGFGGTTQVSQRNGLFG